MRKITLVFFIICSLSGCIGSSFGISGRPIELELPLFCKTDIDSGSLCSFWCDSGDRHILSNMDILTKLLPASSGSSFVWGYVHDRREACDILKRGESSWEDLLRKERRAERQRKK